MPEWLKDWGGGKMEPGEGGHLKCTEGEEYFLGGSGRREDNFISILKFFL